MYDLLPLEWNVIIREVIENAAESILSQSEKIEGKC